MGVTCYDLWMIECMQLAYGYACSDVSERALCTLPKGPTHLVYLPLLFGGATPTFCSRPLVQGMTEVKVRVTEAAVAVHIVQALPHHLLLL